MTFPYLLSVVAGLILLCTMAALFVHMRTGAMRRHFGLFGTESSVCGLGLVDCYLAGPTGFGDSLGHLPPVPSRRSLLAAVALIDLVIALMVIAAPNVFASAVVALVDALPRS